MKNFLFFNKYVLRGLVLSVFLLGSMFTAQSAQAAASPCSTDHTHYGLITADETWCVEGDGIHYLSDNVIVQAGVTLTIEPGVTLLPAQETMWKYLVIQGHLDVLGTAEHPVLMSLSDPNLPWGGLYFDGSAGDGSADINYATIEKAGANVAPPGLCWNCGTSQFALLVKDLPAGKQVNINNSILRDNPIKGLYVINSTVNVTNTTFSHNIYPILIEGAASVVTYSGNTFSDNAYPYYDNTGYTIQEDSIFINQDALTGQNFNLPAQTGLEAYVWWENTTIPAGVTMSVEPGVTLRKAANNYFIVQGHLDVTGTPTLPVLFTGIPNSNSNPNVIGNWGGLYFDGSAGDGSADINYATIEKAGSNLSPPGYCWNCGPSQFALLVKDLPAGKQVHINNSILRDNPIKGLFVSNGRVNVTNTTFSHDMYPISIDGVSSVVTYAGNTFSDNAYPVFGNYMVPEDAIFISPDALMGQDFSLPAQTGLDAYVFSGTTIPAGVTMTVEPGVTLRMAVDMPIIVQGHLDAIGTPALPIRFTGIPSSDTVINNWGGLIFDGPSGASGHLDHAIVERGCGWWNSNCVTLMIYHLAADKSVLVEHSTVQNSTNVDLAVIDSPTAQVDNNLIKGGNIGVYLATNMTVSNLAVTDQVLDGVYVESGYTAEARHLTIARTGRNGFYVNTGGTGLLKNSILSHNVLAVKAEGSGQASLDTNLADANTTFSSGAVTELNTIDGSATFEADGYHIQTTSDAVGIGLAGLSVGDIDGDLRPMPAGSLPDLGTDEVTDVTAPVVASITRSNPNPTSTASVDFSVTFSEPVTGVDIGDFTLTTALTGASVTGVSGIGHIYTVTVNTGSGNGTLRLDVPDSATITDRVGIPLASLPYVGGDNYNVDKSAPTVVSSLRANPDPTSAASVDFTVTFSKSVTGVDVTDFSISQSGLTGTSVTNVAGSGTTYTLTASTGSGDGSLRLDLVDDDTIIDSTGNPLGGVGTSNGNFDTGESYTVQKSLGAGIYDDPDAALTYTGNWYANAASGAYLDTIHTTGSIGDSAAINFSGQQFKLIYLGAPVAGILDVYVDDVKVGSINQYSANWDQQKAWTSDLFPAGAHTLRFVYASGGSFTDLDAIQVIATPALLSSGGNDDFSTNLNYEGRWYTLSGITGPASGTLHYSSAPGDELQGSFTGQQFKLLYLASPYSGLMDVYVDGVKVTTINQYSEYWGWQTSWTSDLFSNGPHSLRLVYASGGSLASLDEIDVINPLVSLASGVNDDTATGFSYDGQWYALTGSGPHGSTLQYSAALGNGVQGVFTGQQIKLTYLASPFSGLVDIYIDGVKIATLNQHSDNWDWQTTWTSDLLSPGTHSFRMLYASGGSIASFDALEVVSSPAVLGTNSYDDFDAGLNYQGRWYTFTGMTGPSLGTLHYMNYQDGTAMLLFSGRQFRLTYLASPTAGVMDVYVDNVKVASLNQHSDTWDWQRVWTSDLYASGTHSLRLVNANGLTTNVDGVEILSSPLILGTNVYDDLAAGLNYDGNWQKVSGVADAYDTTFQYSNGVGENLEVPFNGKQIKLTYLTSPTFGTADVYIDGVKVTTLDQNSADWTFGVSWTSDVLPAGDHSLRLVHAGGVVVAIDAAEVIP